MWTFCSLDDGLGRPKTGFREVYRQLLADYLC